MKLLGDLSEQESEYQKKVGKLATKIAKSMNPKAPVQHGKDHANNWKYVSEVAEVCEDGVNAFMQRLVASLKKFPVEKSDDDDSKNDESDVAAEVLVKNAVIMDEATAHAEVASSYGGNWLRLVHVCNGKIVFNSFRDLYLMLLMLAKYNQNCGGFEVASVSQESDNTLEWPHFKVLIRPAPKESKKKKKAANVNYACTRAEEKVLDELKLNMPTEDDDEDEEEDKNAEEFLNLPGHVCEVALIHKAMLT
eukprot:CAMPEP_0202694902 /NCGR_PEP_ID=MMETSP1385-20130828/8638_1 /ASSEMBLY_ACC=CAM_ASM_000861 /TAXON_ID=933848 /ORGANISM="Elphidium margaritaceum" /LENGTH=249 /DNA_ID=CAMNT_0049350837 /DNA_START=126 /DNA_END=875 /DNA_ORIENTATION=+